MFVLRPRARIIAIRPYLNYSIEEIKDDTMIKSALERDLYVIVQSAIDLAEATVAFKNFRKPITMREAFDILKEENILTSEFVQSFGNIVGFRNAVAHNYENLRLEVIYDVLHNKLKEVEVFLKHIEDKFSL